VLVLVGAAEAIQKPAMLGPLLLGINTLLYTGINTLHSLCLTHIALDRTVSKFWGDPVSAIRFRSSRLVLWDLLNL